MAHDIESHTNTAPNQLREALDQAERLIVTVDRTSVEALLVLLDSIQQMLTAFSDEEIDMRSEEGRWQGLLSRLMSRPDNIAAAAAAAGGFAALRAKHPPAEGMWWRLDSYIGQRRRKGALRFVTTLLAIVGVVAILYFVVNTLFPPDPAAVMMVDATSNISQLIQQDRWEDALVLTDETLVQLPHEAELLIWRTVLLEHLGRSEEAAAALQTAQADFTGSDALFWVILGNTRYQAGDVDGAEVAGQQAVSLDPQEPQAYLLLGGVAEMRGDAQTAIEMFDKTFTLAEPTNPQLAVIAKVRLSQVLQSPMLQPPPGSETPTPAPTPAPTTAP